MDGVPAIGDRLSWRSTLVEVVDVAAMTGWTQVVVKVVDDPRRLPISLPLNDLVGSTPVETERAPTPPAVEIQPPHTVS